jgi:hypothetical protein
MLCFPYFSFVPYILILRVFLSFNFHLCVGLALRTACTNFFSSFRILKPAPARRRCSLPRLAGPVYARTLLFTSVVPGTRRDPWFRSCRTPARLRPRQCTLTRAAASSLSCGAPGTRASWVRTASLAWSSSPRRVLLLTPILLSFLNTLPSPSFRLDSSQRRRCPGLGRAHIYMSYLCAVRLTPWSSYSSVGPPHPAYARFVSWFLDAPVACAARRSRTRR